MTVFNGATGFILENENAWYPNIYNMCNYYDGKCYIGVKIENNKIYYLYPNVDFENRQENYYGYMEEREYTINNNKLEYKVLNKYKIINGAGQVC